MNLRPLSALAALLLAACSSTVPTPGSMDKYYREAEAQVSRDLSRLHARLESGEISAGEYEVRAEAIRDSVGARASKMAWTHHELAEAEKRSMQIPTGDRSVRLEAPGASGDSMRRQAGMSGGAGYSGIGGRADNTAPAGFRFPGAVP